jgi:hypothetical protein
MCACWKGHNGPDCFEYHMRLLVFAPNLLVLVAFRGEDVVSCGLSQKLSKGGDFHRSQSATL